ncbi:MAG: HD domain-containing protein [Planctomycetaceae bacterium]|nr:HD domain-containing protein [Planctomycetaceae bacterium]
MSSVNTDCPPGFQLVPLSYLAVGAKLREPIFDAGSMDRDLLLLAAGKKISQGVLDQLAKRGVTEVRISIRELQRMQKAKSALSDPNSAASAAVKRASHIELRDVSQKFGVSVKSHINQVKQHGETAYQSEKLQTFVEAYQETTKNVASLLDGMCSGDIPETADLVGVSQTQIDQIAEDMDLVVSLGLHSKSAISATQRSLKTAMHAMSVGTTLGLPANELVELGIGCLVHDVGMRFVPPELINSPNRLDDIDFLEVTKHPSITFDLLRELPDVPTGSRMVAYQMHERWNGSGYPRQRHGVQIHTLARIAMVADVFIALLTPRPDRPAILPYDAMRRVLEMTQEGLFDPEVVRGLLKTTSLFPIGSYVALNDSRTARVVRAHRELFTRPVVEIISLNDKNKSPEVVNIATAPGLEIVRAVPNPFT